MDIKQLQTHLRSIFLRQWMVYILAGLFIFIAVDVPKTIRSVQISKLNDLSGDLPMTKLYDFAKDRIAPSNDDWQRFKEYFQMILEIFPGQPVAELFLGVSEYYASNNHGPALFHLRKSADNDPSLFWNLYNIGILSFQKGDMDMAIAYLEKALLIPLDATIYTMAGSVLYRQFLLVGHNTDLMARLNLGHERAILVLVAALVDKNNLDMAEVFIKKAINHEGIINKEPFYFYAGEIALKRNMYDEAIFAFRKAMSLKTKNYLVYRHCADILKLRSNLQDAAKLAQLASQFESLYPFKHFPYFDYLQLEFF